VLDEGERQEPGDADGPLVAPPDAVALAINHEHMLATEAAEDAITHAIRCGELLIQQKHRSRHGTFQAWVRDHCEFSHDTANAYMRAARAKTSGLVFSSLREIITRERAEKRCRKVHIPLFTRPDPKDFELPADLDRNAWSVARETMESIHRFAVVIRDLDPLDLCSASVTQDLKKIRPDVARVVWFATQFMDVCTGIEFQGTTPKDQVERLRQHRDSGAKDERCDHCGHPPRVRYDAKVLKETIQK
jgi:Protein of unknown function (DUF3102)